MRKDRLSGSAGGGDGNQSVLPCPYGRPVGRRQRRSRKAEWFRMRHYSVQYKDEDTPCLLCGLGKPQVVEKIDGGGAPELRRYCLDCLQQVIVPAIQHAVTPRIFDVVLMKSNDMSSAQMAELVGARGIIIAWKNKRSIIDFVGHSDLKLADPTDLRILYRPPAEQVRERENQARSYLRRLQQADGSSSGDE